MAVAGMAMSAMALSFASNAALSRHSQGIQCRTASRGESKTRAQGDREHAIRMQIPKRRAGGIAGWRADHCAPAWAAEAPRLADAAAKQDKAALRAHPRQSRRERAAGRRRHGLHWAVHWDDLESVDFARAGANVNAKMIKAQRRFRSLARTAMPRWSRSCCRQRESERSRALRRNAADAVCANGKRARGESAARPQS